MPEHNVRGGIDVKSVNVALDCDCLQAEEGMFDSAQGAMLFATDVLRRRRFPKIGNTYNGEKPRVMHMAAGEDDKYTLALSVYQCLARLDEDMQRLLKLHFWGDYVETQKLHAAIALQEKWRQEGKRVRLSYMYSQRQLASILGVGKSTVERRLNKALRLLSRELVDVGLLRAIE